MNSMLRPRPALLALAAVAGLTAAGSYLQSSPGRAAPAPDNNGQLIVHEWGTFLSVQGSDGSTQGGMVDSDELLPPFVETRSVAAWTRSLFRQKGETPVTYFYTDRPRVVQVKVDMPEGVLTHWYPAVCRFGPSPLEKTAAPRNSYLDWCNVTLIPDSAPTRTAIRTETIATRKGQVFTGIVGMETAASIELILGGGHRRFLAKKDIQERAASKSGLSNPALLPVATEQTWKYVRDTDSAFVKIEAPKDDGGPATQYEKFLFYRGLGTFSMPVEVHSAENTDGLTLRLHNRSNDLLRGVFAVNVEKDKIQFARLYDLAPQGMLEMNLTPRFTSPESFEQGVPQVKAAVASVLEQAGLYAKEAQAMVNTWERSYFKTPGLRLLYLVPRQRVDAVIPIHIKPAPDKLVRVMVGRIEVLTPSRERQIARYVADLGADNFRVRQTASANLQGLGRLTEPALRRVLQNSPDPEVRSRAQSLIEGMSAGK
jgi:hypothetical protein